MKIRQLKRYRAPQYPTMAEAQNEQRLLERIPRRWMASQPFASLLGAGLLTKALLAQAEEPTATKTKGAQAEVAQKTVTPNGRRAAETVRQAQRVATVVAPILDEALASDGRGSFGCVAVNPPTFLSENEALELIQGELEKAGLKLQDKVTAEGVEAPLVSDPLAGMRGKGIKLGMRSYDFDLGDTNRSVAVEFFSLHDYRCWKGMSGSSVESFDFPKLMEQVSASFRKRREGRPLVLGLFFDPLAHAPYGRADMTGLSKPLAELAEVQERAARNQSVASLHDLSKEKLRNQVLHFVAYLRQEKILPKE